MTGIAAVLIAIPVIVAVVWWGVILATVVMPAAHHLAARAASTIQGSQSGALRHSREKKS